MAKTKAVKVKPVKRWVIRENRENGWYMLFIGAKPRRSKKTWDSTAEGFVDFECPTKYERFCPEDCHLKLGGGPVEIKVVKVKAVKP